MKNTKNILFRLIGLLLCAVMLFAVVSCTQTPEAEEGERHRNAIKIGIHCFLRNKEGSFYEGLRYSTLQHSRPCKGKF